MKARALERIVPPVRSPDCRCEGAILVFALILVMLLGIFAMAVLKIDDMVGVEASRDINRANAFWTSEAGLQFAKTIVQATRDKIDDSLVQPNVITGATSRGTFSVSISNEWDNVVHVYKKYTITSTGIVPGDVTYTNVVSLHAYLPTFARYAHASHNENGVAFTTGDYIDGPVEIDGQMNINGTPTFSNGLVKAGSVNPSSAAANTSIFTGGIDVNPAYTNNFVNGTSYFARVKSDAGSSTNSGLVLTNDYNFIFKTNIFTYQRTTGGAVYTNKSLLVQPNGGTIYVNGNIWVQGVVSGRLSVAAQNTIYITNDIVYASAINPKPWDAGFNINNVSDFLGLVASNNVTITKTNDVTIDAAVLVTAGGFNATAYNQNIGLAKINLFGSLGQYTRGAVGQVGVNGFRKNYMFDTRFEYDGPPSSAYDFYQFSGWSNMGGN